MDDLRAMREAHFAKVAPRAARPERDAARSVAPVAPPVRRTKAAAEPDPVAEPVTGSDAEPVAGPDAGPDAAEQLCGHRAISGRTCTREAGHAAKNHRYS